MNLKNIKIPAIFLFYLLGTLNKISGQFKITEDNILKLRTITFRDERWPVQIPIVIKKSYSLEKSNSVDTVYEIGLFIHSTLPNDAFMKTGGYIVFMDGSHLRFTEDLIITFFHVGGLHQISLKHKLINSELDLLRVKEVDYISLADNVFQVGKYQRTEIKKLFSDVLIK